MVGMRGVVSVEGCVVREGKRSSGIEVSHSKTAFEAKRNSALVDQIAITRTVRVAAGVFAPGHLGELTRFIPFEMDRSGTTNRPSQWTAVADAWQALRRPYPAAYAPWREAEDASR